MRLFVAIELPERIRTAVEDLTGRACAGLPPARWVPAANLHLTLVFLGDTEEARLAPLAAALTSAAGGRPRFRMRLEGSGCFPPRGRARIAWLGFDSSPEVVELQAAVAAALRAAVGLEPERRPFRPHLTVARCAPPWPPAAARRWSGALDGGLGDAFRVDSVALVRSRLSAAGARYATVQRFALGGAA